MKPAKKTSFKILVLGLLLFINFAEGEVKDPVYDELEGFPLVEALIRDKKLDLAQEELKGLPQNARYWLLSGDLHMAAEKFKEAKASYLRAPRSPQRELRLGRNYFNLKDFLNCQTAFTASKNLWINIEADAILKATCEYNNGSFEAAWKSLVEAESRLKSFALRREKVSFLLEMALVQKAFEAALTSWKTDSASQILALAELFNNKRAFDEALLLVELARMRFPFDLDVNLSFAQLYFQKGQWLATVEGFERASKTDAKYSYHVTELRRQLGHHEQAVYASQWIPDSKERLKSRMAIYVDGGNYAMIASLEAVLSRSELRDDDEVRYALAYSLARQGNLDRTLTHLNRIQKPELLEKTALLKKTILECQSTSTPCQL